MTIIPLLLALAPTFTPHSGMIITSSGKAKPGVYRLVSQPPAAIQVKGDNLTLDFGGATLEGSDPTVEPDEREGVALAVSGKNILIKNLRARGFKTGLIARGCEGLRLEGCDLSYNWKPHLGSTLEAEDLNDWLSYHHNENDEWLEYGGGIYLVNCSNFVVTKCVIRGGQDGLKISRSDHGGIFDNDFSFLSGIGLGLYRSSNNHIHDNSIDWCVRGYSDGVYNRGQDSAGILIYEQSNDNVFEYNSVTHGGDGFFLWAGQTTMDTGKGGCNGNIVRYNDFSYAPTNGIETTFSSNQFLFNKVIGCWHGVWGGYSWDSLWQGNLIAENEEGFAIEHGQHNKIVDNDLMSNKTGIHLWKNATQDPDWGYPKGHDTDSHDYQITGNRFVVNDLAIWLRDTRDVRFLKNELTNNKLRLKVEGQTPGVTEAESSAVQPAGRLWDASTRAWMGDPKLGRKFLSAKRLQGRRYMLVDEWGPYDFRSPRMWPREARQDVQRFELLGPVGKWKLKSVTQGVKLSASFGSVPGFLEATIPSGQTIDLKIELEYMGAATIDYRGNATPAGKPVPFGFSKFYAPIKWVVNWVKWDDASDPRTHYDEFVKLKPVSTKELPKLEMQGSRMAEPFGLPRDHFGAFANGTFTVPPGDYTLEATTDDGMRVWVDDKLVIDSWKYQGPTVYTAKLKLGGQHRIRTEYFQIDGYAQLRVVLKKS